MDVESISWHPGFAEGLRETYIKYSDGLEFKDEFQLTKEPLRIDVVIVKKRPDLIVDTDTGRIFRGHNIFEYKSPSDYVSVNDFLKVCAYVWLYA
ncbi:MAG: 3-isopropylmalate dehydrogenase, partial [Oscillospiraceae bacterium]|nr:3-isopropylmalate dehydrogenase [Oscillospiraceae bacterium]